MKDSPYVPRPARNDEWVEINADVEKELANAWILDVYVTGQEPVGCRNVCMGKSVCRRTGEGTFEVKRWLAEKNNLL